MTILLALALTLVAQDSVKIDGDGTITLQSGGDKLTIRGVLDGEVEAAGAIRVPGNRNTVQWKDGLKDDAKPRISVLGKKNSVARGD